MDGTLFAVVGLVALMIVGCVAIGMMVFVFWRNSHFYRYDTRIKELEGELKMATRNSIGMANLMQDQLVAYDHELTQVWDYVLPKKEMK